MRGLLRSVSLFTGAGGLDYGLEAAGFTTVSAVEFDPDACATLSMSREWPVFFSPIERVTGKSLRHHAAAGNDEIALLSAGPPCQPFSKSANWVSGQPAGMADQRANPLRDLVRIIEELLPVALLIENVPGFGGEKNGEGFLGKALADINARKGTSYKLNAAILNAADFGVPQMRRRLFLLANRDGRPFRFPDPTHGGEGQPPWVNTWDAIGNIEDGNDEELRVKGRWADLLPSIPEGSNYLWHTDRGGGVPLFGWRTKYWSFLLKLAKDRPSWTIPASPSQNTGPFHWDNRRLSSRELLKLQTFPDDVALAGSYTSKQKQLGNAVPSLLAEVLGRAIAKQWLGVVHADDVLRLRVTSARSVPAPMQPTTVPAKYGVLRGRHEAHPGHGLGPGAIRRQTSWQN